MSDSRIKLCMGCMSALEEPQTVCPICGFVEDTPYSVDYLPPQTVLSSRYLVGSVVDTDREGVYYIGLDQEEDVKVWIKEYMPLEFAARNHTLLTVTPLAGFEVQYKSFLEGFKDMALQFKAMSCSSIVPPIALVEENNTAYVVYKYIKTISLGDFLSRSGGELSWVNARKVYMPLLNTLSSLHKKGIAHGGISPSTILIDKQGKLFLYEFIFSEVRVQKRSTESNAQQSYTAPEQYDERSFQGPWTDVYGMGAVLYKTLTGTQPPDALGRLMDHKALTSVRDLNAQIPENVSNAISEAMELDPEKRLQSIDALIGKLLESESSNTAVYETTPRVPQREDDEEREITPKKLKFRTARFVTSITLVVSVVLAVTLFLTLKDFIFPSSVEEDPITDTVYEEGMLLPSFAGQIVEAVTSNPEYQGKLSFHVLEVYNQQFAKGFICEQIPAAGSKVMPNSKVTLYVSKGSDEVPMPDLVGSTTAFVRKTLEQAQIAYDIVEIVKDSGEPGLVFETKPIAGEIVKTQSEKVMIYVTKAAPPVEPPAPEPVAPPKEPEKPQEPVRDSSGYYINEEGQRVKEGKDYIIFKP